MIKVGRARRAVGLRRLAGGVAAVGLLTAVLVGPATAAVGDQLFWNGGSVTVDVQYADAGFTSGLYLYYNYTDATPNVADKIFIAYNCNSSPAACTGLPSIPVALPSSMDPGDELVFGIEVVDTNQRYLIGPGTRNPDGRPHANVTTLGPTSAQVGFEDILGGGDNDFNDNLFNFTAVIINHPPTSDAGDDVAGDEGSAIALDGAASGADVGETLTSTWSVAPGAGVDAGASCSFTDEHDPTTDITCTDDGTFIATLSVFDGTSTDTDDVNVVVGNANPQVSASFAASAVSCGTAGSLTVSFTDDGSNDTHSASIDWGDGSGAQSISPFTSGTAVPYTYAHAGSYNAQVTVTDDDLGAGSDNSNTIATNFTVVGGGVQQPINQTGPMSIFKSKSTIPVKISFLDCDGSPATSLAPTISVQKLNGNTPSGVDEPIVSTSNADTGTTMRVAGTGYIYNLAAQSLSDSSATYRLKITVPATGQTTTVDFGLKP